MENYKLASYSIVIVASLFLCVRNTFALNNAAPTT